MSNLKTFGETAFKLSRNPLGIIALFIVLVYALASLVISFSNSLQQPSERLPLVWFLVLFPVIVLLVFAWLVSKHHEKLYSPKDFRQEENFIRSLYNPKLHDLRDVTPSGGEDFESNVVENETTKRREDHRNSIYQKNKGYFITHVIEPSEDGEQLYDIFIYLIRHKSENYSDIAKVEFFFGSYWDNEVFEGNNVGGFIGVKTSAYGEFLCTCQITFRDKSTVLLERYIDFEMGKIVQGIIKK